MYQLLPACGCRSSCLALVLLAGAVLGAGWLGLFLFSFLLGKPPTRGPAFQQVSRSLFWDFDTFSFLSCTTHCNVCLLSYVMAQCAQSVKARTCE